MPMHRDSDSRILKQFTTGNYKTAIGFNATVARLEQLSVNDWVLRGAISMGGALYLHVWRLNGKSLLDTKFDLMRSP